MKKHHFKEVLVVPRAMVPLENAEAAQNGQAAMAVNVREREQSLQVTGVPTAVGTVAAGDRLLLLTGDHCVSCRGNRVMIDNVAVASVTGALIGAYALGGVIVIAATNGFTYLLIRTDGRTILLSANRKNSTGNCFHGSVTLIPLRTLMPSGKPRWLMPTSAR